MSLRARQRIYQLSWPRAAVYHIGPTWVRTENLPDLGEKRTELRRRRQMLARQAEHGSAQERAKATTALKACGAEIASLHTSAWRPIGPSCVYPEKTGDVSYYDPFDALGAASDLARVHVASAEWASARRNEEAASPERDPIGRAVLTFVNGYGLLGQAALGAPPNVIVMNGRRYVADGDELGWFLDHARNVHLALSLIGALHPVSTDHLRALLEPLAERQDLRDKERRRERVLRLTQEALGKGLEAERASAVLKAEKRVTVKVAGRDVGLPDLRPLLVPTVTPPWRAVVQVNIGQSLREAGEVTTGKRLLAELLTPNLTGATRVIHPDTGVAVFRFTALVQALYWQVADRAGSRPPRSCQECGGLFFPDDEREQFCPPPPGIRESRCGRRIRMRALRARRESSQARRSGANSPSGKTESRSDASTTDLGAD